MPVDRQVQLRYAVLNKCFRNRYREYTIDDLVEECNKALLREYDIERGVSKRTIQVDIANLQMPPYRVRLDEKLRSGKKRIYRYVDTDYSLPQIKLNDFERNKIQDAICVLRNFEGDPQYDWVRTCLMQIEGGFFDARENSIVSFQTNPDLKGISLFGALLDAIANKHTIELTYKPFGQEGTKKNVYPYFLKQYNNRWYLLATEKGFDSITTCALDRIETFRDVAIPYKECDIDFEEYFDDVIGVSVPDTPVEDVILRVSKKRYNYIMTKPLHMSQRKIEESETTVTLMIKVKINRELESSILSYGSDVEVLAPDFFRKQIADEITSVNHFYINNAANLHT